MKTKLLIVVITLVFLAVGLSGCTQEDALSGLGYINRNYSFGLNPPAGWTVDENDPFGAIVRFYGPIDEEGVNIGITGPSLLDGETLSSVVAQTITTYESLFTNFSLISSDSRTVNSMNAYELVYTFTQGTFQLKQKQVAIEKDNKALVLTYSALLSSYDTYLSVFEQSLSSLVIT